MVAIDRNAPNSTTHKHTTSRRRRVRADIQTSVRSARLPSPKRINNGWVERRHPEMRPAPTTFSPRGMKRRSRVDANIPRCVPRSKVLPTYPPSTAILPTLNRTIPSPQPLQSAGCEIQNHAQCILLSNFNILFLLLPLFLKNTASFL